MGDFRYRYKKARKSSLFYLVFSSLAELDSVFVIEFLVAALVKSIADFLHKLVIEIKVMKNGKAHAESLFCLEKMANIGS